SSSDQHPQPQRGCGPPVPARASDLSYNAVGVDSISQRSPKVGVARQPWAGGPSPFGIVWSAGLRPGGIPEGCQILAGGRRETGTTGNLGKQGRTLAGCQK